MRGPTGAWGGAEDVAECGALRCGGRGRDHGSQTAVSSWLEERS